MDVALVEDAKHDIDRGDRGEDQERHVADRLLEDLGVSGKLAVQRDRNVKIAHGALDGVGGLAQRHVRRQVEGEGGRHERALMIDRTAASVEGPKWLKADSGTMVSTLVVTAAPVETPPRALVVSALSCWLRNASAATSAAVCVAVLEITVVPATAPVACVPETRAARRC